MVEQKSSIIAKVNEVSIVVLDQEKLVPVKPICEALGVAYPSQYFICPFPGERLTIILYHAHNASCMVKWYT
jgi:hypothetical protein